MTEWINPNKNKNTDRLKKLQDPEQAKDFIQKFGDTAYKRYVNYYTTKKTMEDYGLDQNEYAPNYAAIDDIFNNYDKYQNDLGKTKFNAYYNAAWEVAKPEIENVNKVIKLKDAGTYGYDVLNQDSALAAKFAYTDDEEDQLRKKAGLVPKAFDSAAKQIVKQAQEIKKTSTPQDVESGLMPQTTAGWDFIDGNTPITEADLRDAISTIMKSNTVAQMGDIYAGGGARRETTRNTADLTGKAEAHTSTPARLINKNADTNTAINNAINSYEQAIDQEYNPRMENVGGNRQFGYSDTLESVGPGTYFTEGTMIDPATGLIVTETAEQAGVPDVYKSDTNYADAAKATELNTLITRLREKKASGGEVTSEELKPLTDLGLTKIVDIIRNTTSQNVAYGEDNAVRMSSEIKSDKQTEGYYGKQEINNLGYTAAVTADADADKKIASVGDIKDYAGDKRRKIISVINTLTPEKTEQEATDIIKKAGVEAIDTVRYMYADSVQRNVLKYLYATGNVEGFDAYAESISSDLNRDNAIARQKVIDEKLGQTGWGKTGAAFLSALAAQGSVASWVEAGVNAAKGIPTDPYSPWQGPANAAEELKDTALKDTSDVGRFFGEAGISILQNAPQMAATIASGGTLAPVTLGMMAGSAAGQTTNQALKSGATSGQAFASGTASGVIEYITEKLPLENLLKIGNAAKGAGKGAVLKTIAANIPAQAGVEGGEEFVAEIANNLTDYILLDDKSQYTQYKNDLIKSGVAPGQADVQTFLQFYGANPIKAGGAGAISGIVYGGLAGGAGALVSQIQTRAAAIQTQQEAAQLSSDIDALISQQTDQQVIDVLTEIKKSIPTIGTAKASGLVDNAVPVAASTQPAEQASATIPTGVATEQETLPEVKTGKKGNLSIPQIPSIGTATKTSKVATSTAKYTGDKVLQEKIGMGLYDYVPQSAEAEYAKQYASVNVANVINNYESPVDTVTKNDTVTATERRYSDKDTAAIAAGLVKAYESGTREEQQRILAIAVDVGLTQGRGVNMFKMLKKLDATGRLYTIERNIVKLNAQGRSIYGKKWTDISLTDGEIATIKQGSKKSEWNAAEKAIFKRINESLPSTLTEKDAALRRIAMLLNPKTHVRNIVGNTIMSGVIEIRDKMIAVAEQFIAKDQRTKSFLVSRGTMAIVRNYFIENDIADELAGQKYEVGRMQLTKGQKRIFKNSVLNALDKATTASLSWEDAMFKRSRYIKSLARFMQARGLTEVTDEAHQYALQDAFEATFQDKSEIAQAIQKLKRTKGLGVAVDVAVPFVTTPVNIVRRTVDYSPFGVGKAGYDFIKAYQAQSELKNETDEARIKAVKTEVAQNVQKGIKNLAQGITGTGLFTLGFLLAAGKLIPGVMITGMSPDSDKEKDFMKANGWQPLAVQVGDTYVSIEWATPIASVVLAGAQAYHEVSDGTQSDWYDVPLQSASALADTITSSSVFTGIRRIMGTGYQGSEAAGKIAQEVGANFVSQHIPSVGGAINNIVEPNKVSYYSSDSVTAVKNKAILSVPALRGILADNGVDVPQATIDSWGQPVSAGNVWQRAFNNLANPATVTKMPSDPVEKAVLELYRSTGDTDAFPRVLDGNLTIEEVKELLGVDSVKMSDTEYTNLKSQIGQSYYRLLSAYIKSPQYGGDTDEVKLDTFKNIYDQMLGAYRTEFIKSKIPSIKGK